MSPDPSDTTILQQLKAGDDPAAAQRLWERYFSRLAGLARLKFSDRQRRVHDEEDVALSALDSFFRGVEQGRFASVEDRNDIWQVLVMLAERKYIDRLRRENADKRGAGKVRGDSVFLNGASTGGGLHEAAADEPTPEFAAAFAEECQRLFAALGNDELRRVALLKSEGYSTAEIAQELGCTPRSVERKLRQIRQIWAKSLAANLDR